MAWKPPEHRGRPARTTGGARPAPARRRPLLPLSLLLGLPLLLASCSRSVELEPAPANVPRIRVLLSDNLDSARVSIHGSYEILSLADPKKPRKLANGNRLASESVSASGGDIIVGDLVRTPSTVEFLPQRAPVELNGQRYRGSLRISPVNGKLRIVNLVDVEGYLRGIVPSEMPPNWPPAALEAQAVAARSYALAKCRERTAEPFDVYSSVYDQKYGGLEREDERANTAVAATVGQVLQFRHRTFTTYYHSCCGGATADGRLVFADPAPPLRGTPCGFCSAAPRYKWSVRISRAEVARKLALTNLAGLSTQGVGLDGRVAQVTLHLTNGTTLAISGTAFRERLGLLSTRFTIGFEGSDFILDGRGWGHGVGLCQWGARGMADARKKRSDILAHYYPGAELVKLY